MAKVIVIGGGASGITAAITAAKFKNEVIILERNDKCAKKILVTGNGRCNYFNEDQNLNHYHSTNKELINELITEENLSKVTDFFDSIGIIPKIKNGYYYPCSNQAASIKEALLKECETKNIKIITNTYVEEVIIKENKFEVKTNNGIYTCDKVIVSTGSKAAPKTGSDGNGYRLLKNLNHNIIKPLPALVQLIGKEKYFKDWEGVRTDVVITLYEDNKKVREEVGELQLTNYGISGICAMQLSGIISRGIDNNKKEIVKINFLHNITNGNEFINWMNIRNKKVQGRTTRELLEGILNYKLVNTILKISNIKDEKWNELNNNQKSLLQKNLTSLELEIISTKSFDNAQTTTGGIPLTEIDLKTMESKLVRGLYIIGEILDVDGDCGGYNLTFSWLTGIKAGEDIHD